jgi:hypothetical protein
MPQNSTGVQFWKNPVYTAANLAACVADGTCAAPMEALSKLKHVVTVAKLIVWAA